MLRSLKAKSLRPRGSIQLGLDSESHEARPQLLRPGEHLQNLGLLESSDAILRDVLKGAAKVGMSENLLKAALRPTY